MGTSGTPGPGGRGRMAYRLQRRQAGARQAEWETLAEQFSQTRERNLKLERDGKLGFFPYASSHPVTASREDSPSPGARPGMSQGQDRGRDAQPPLGPSASGQLSLLDCELGEDERVS